MRLKQMHVKFTAQQWRILKLTKTNLLKKERSPWKNLLRAGYTRMNTAIEKSLDLWREKKKNLDITEIAECWSESNVIQQ